MIVCLRHERNLKMIDLKDQLQGKTVFVTGADGFIGSHLCELLVECGASVRALIHYNSWSSKGWLDNVEQQIIDQIDFVEGDVRDAELMRRSVAGASYVMHLASLIAIPYSYNAPRSYVETNVVGTLNILEAVRESDTVERMLHTSTSETYGTAQYVPIDESHPLVGQSPYAASKIAADKLAESYARSFSCPVVTARPFNTYGPRQTARAVIPSLLAQLASGSSEIVLGATSPTRDFNFVKDTIRGLCYVLLGRFDHGEVVNIGTGNEISIGDLAELMIKQFKPDAIIVSDENRIRPAASEVERLLADSNKLKTNSGWVPIYSLNDGLAETYGWILENLRYFTPHKYAI